jgi:hypothetical protein
MSAEHKAILVGPLSCLWVKPTKGVTLKRFGGENGLYNNTKEVKQKKSVFSDFSPSKY